MKLISSITKSTPKIIRRIPSVRLGSSKPSKKPFFMPQESSRTNSKVPKGFLAVYVGPELRRFVIPVSFLAMPDFRVLMENVAEEYGCDHHGAIQIPCDENCFQQILMSCSQRKRIISPKNLTNMPLICSH